MILNLMESHASSISENLTDNEADKLSKDLNQFLLAVDVDLLQLSEYIQNNSHLLKDENLLEIVTDKLAESNTTIGAVDTIFTSENIIKLKQLTDKFDMTTKKSATQLPPKLQNAIIEAEYLKRKVNMQKNSKAK